MRQSFKVFAYVQPCVGSKIDAAHADILDSTGEASMILGNKGGFFVTLHFEDESGLSEHTDRLRIDFCDSQVGYVKTFAP